jgi:serine/threonine protein kinase
MSTPTVIARYEVLNRIGRGGMGSLYLARDPKIDRLVAIKILNADLERDDVRMRFDREARAAGALNHPNIVTIFDYGVFEDAPYIVMEYIRGETLAEVIKRRAPLTLAQKLGLLDQLCRGLGYAHEAGIIHRDIKPSNLMLDQHDVLKILDFGIARIAESGLTQMSVSIGTPGYMSPEQIDGRKVERASDVFAVGAVAYELLTYRPAFAGDSPHATIYNVLHSTPAPMLSLAPEVGPDVAAIVERALEKSTEIRYTDISAMHYGLQAAREALGPAIGTPGRISLDVGPRLTPTPGSDRTVVTLGQPTSTATSPTESLLMSARQAFAEGEAPRALSLIDRLLALEPGRPDAVALQQQVEEAVVEDLLKQARTCLSEQRLIEAGEFVSRALRIRPRSEAALRMQSDVDYRRLGVERRAAGRVRANVAVERGWAYVKEGAWDAARRVAEEARALDPESVDAVKLLEAAEAGALKTGAEAAGVAPLAGKGPVHARGAHVGGPPARSGPSLAVVWSGGAAVVAVVAIGIFVMNRPGVVPPPADTTPPSVVIESPADGKVVTGPESIRVRASDNVAIAGVRIAVDGEPLAELKGPPYEASWASANAADGPHVISVEARDAAGQTTTASVRVLSSNAVTTRPAPVPDAGSPRPPSDADRLVIRQLLEQADSNMNEGKYQDALTNTDAILRLDPRNAQALKLRQEATTAKAAEDRKKRGRGGL